MNRVNWRPISEARRNGTEYLLWFPEDVLKGRNAGAITGWYFSSPKKIDDGWETIIGSIGEPTMFAEIETPPITLALLELKRQALEMDIKLGRVDLMQTD